MKKILNLIICFIVTITLVSGCNSNKHFKLLNDMKYGQVYHKLTLLPDGRVLSIGNGITQIYDFNCDSWNSIESNYKHFNQNQILLNNGNVIVLDVEGSEFFDSKTSKFYKIKPNITNMPMNNFSSILLENGNILIIGLDGEKARIYDPEKNNFKLTDKMTCKRLEPEMLKLKNGNILILGGDKNNISIEIYDYKNNKFYNAGYLQIKRRGRYTRTGYKATLLNNEKILITGGYDDKNNVVKTVEIYDLATKKSTILKNEFCQRGDKYYYKAILLQNGNVLFIGGFIEQNGKNIENAELFNLTNNHFITIGKSKYSRIGSDMVLLKSGNVLITGGLGHSWFNETPPPLKKVELYKY